MSKRAWFLVLLFPFLLGAIPVLHHDTLDGFVASEHIDWTSATDNLSTSGTIEANNVKLTGYLCVIGPEQDPFWLQGDGTSLYIRTDGHLLKTNAGVFRIENMSGDSSMFSATSFHTGYASLDRDNGYAQLILYYGDAEPAIESNFYVNDSGDLEITSSGGDISFDDENLTTTGTIEGGGLDINGEVTITGSAGDGNDAPDALTVTGGTGGNGGMGTGYIGSDLIFTAGPGGGGMDGGAGGEVTFTGGAGGFGSINGGAGGDMTLTAGAGVDADNTGGAGGDVNLVSGAGGSTTGGGTDGIAGDIFATTSLGGDGATYGNVYLAKNGGNVRIGSTSAPTVALDVTGAIKSSTTVTANTLALGTGSITDSSGAIDFDNEILSTTGIGYFGPVTTGGTGQFNVLSSAAVPFTSPVTRGMVVTYYPDTSSLTSTNAGQFSNKATGTLASSGTIRGLFGGACGDSGNFDNNANSLVMEGLNYEVDLRNDFTGKVRGATLKIKGLQVRSFGGSSGYNVGTGSGNDLDVFLTNYGGSFEAILDGIHLTPRTGYNYGIYIKTTDSLDTEPCSPINSYALYMECMANTNLNGGESYGFYCESDVPNYLAGDLSIGGTTDAGTSCEANAYTVGGVPGGDAVITFGTDSGDCNSITFSGGLYITHTEIP